MKKLLLFITLFCSVITFAQNEGDKLVSLSSIVAKSSDSKVLDSVLVELNSMKQTTTDPGVKKLLPEIISLASELSAMSKVIVPAKNLSELSKEDLKGFRVETDDFKKSSFIYRKGWGFEDRFSPYIVLNKGNINLRWLLKYRGSRWVFMDKVLFIIDGEDFSVDVSPKRDVISGTSVSEYADVFGDENVITILRKVAAAKENVRIRYQGERSEDSAIDLGTCKKIGDVLALYDKLKK